MLDFKPLTLDMKGKVDRYFFAYGGGSCQHAFTSSFCLVGKYGDQFCERDGFLYVLRSRLCGPEERVYLLPQGDMTDRDAARRAIREVLDDAHGHGVSPRFDTLAQGAERLLELLPGFTAVENRDRAEYVYSFDKLANLPGHEMTRKRQAIHAFEREYGSRSSIVPIEAEHIPVIRAFQRCWLEAKIQGLELRGEDVMLKQDDAAIQRGLDYFFELGLSGIVVFIDGTLRGYAYGAPLSGDCYDVMVEKGDEAIPNIYRVLNRDLVRLCCQGRAWINREEDMGIPGLRTAKMRYKPDFLIKKFTLREERGR